MASATAKTSGRILPDPLNSVQNAAFAPECPHHASVTDVGQPCRARPPRHLTRDSGYRHGSGHIRQLAGSRTRAIIASQAIRIALNSFFLRRLILKTKF